MARTIVKLVEELFASITDLPRAEALMNQIYDPNMYFQDPIQRVDGLETLKQMNRDMMEKNSDVAFKLVGITGDKKALAAEWVMHFKVAGRPISLPGVSWLSLNDAGRCYRHVDYWDWMGLSDQVLPPLKIMHDLMRKAVG